MNTKEVYSYTKIHGIEIGEVTSVSYDWVKDIVIVVEDKGNSVGAVKHCFGSKAEGLTELIDALEIYQEKKFDERKKVLDRVRRAIAGEK